MDSNLTGVELEVAKLRAEFNLLRQSINRTEYSNLKVFDKDVLFNGRVRVTGGQGTNDEAEYNLVPDYIEVAEGLSSVVGSTSTWEDWDLSSAIPANALRVDISIVNKEAVEYVAGVRENGSSQSRFMFFNPDSQSIMTSNLDSGRIIERYSTNANIVFAVRGYYI